MRRRLLLLCFFSAITRVSSFQQRYRNDKHQLSSSLGLSSTQSSFSSPQEIIHLTNIDKVYVISDLHTDSLDNLEWLRNSTKNGTRFGPSDLVVVAGDISHEIDRLQDSLRLLLANGASVLFVPGNHEAWLHSRNDDHMTNSLQKLDLIDDICQQMGVLTCGKPLLVGATKERPQTMWIVPMESWYDATLSIRNCEDLCDDFQKWPWVDFIKCEWPDFPLMDGMTAKIPMGLTEYFIEKNVDVLKQVQKSVLASTETLSSDSTYQKAVMTVSHFLPNQQCLPDWKDFSATEFNRDQWLDHGAGGNSAKFAKVAGTQLLDDQIRGLDLHASLPDSIRRIHLFGHSHRPKDFEFDGIRYIHNPLGKPRERDLYLVPPDVDFQLLWDTTTRAEGGGGELVAKSSIIRYWEEKGGGVEALRERMKKTKRKTRYPKHRLNL